MPNKKIPSSQERVLTYQRLVFRRRLKATEGMVPTLRFVLDEVGSDSSRLYPATKGTTVGTGLNTNKRVRFKTGKPKNKALAVRDNKRSKASRSAVG